MVSTQVLSEKPEIRPKSDAGALSTGGKFNSLPWQPDGMAEYSRVGMRWFSVVMESLLTATGTAVGI